MEVECREKRRRLYLALEFEIKALLKNTFKEKNTFINRNHYNLSLGLHPMIISIIDYSTYKTVTSITRASFVCRCQKIVKYCFLCPDNSSKPKDIIFTMLKNREKLQILTIKKLEQVNDEPYLLDELFKSNYQNSSHSIFYQ